MIYGFSLHTPEQTQLLREAEASCLRPRCGCVVAGDNPCKRRTVTTVLRAANAHTVLERPAPRPAIAAPGRFL